MANTCLGSARPWVCCSALKKEGEEGKGEAEAGEGR